MKGCKKNLVYALVFAGILSFSNPAVSAISDTGSHWAAARIYKWVNNGIINGYPDGTFRPDSTITRAEFASMISKLFKYTDTTAADFSDVSQTAWYSETVAKAYNAGIIEGFNGKFNPDSKITRQEAAIILAKAFELEPQKDNSSDYFNDSGKISSWSKDYINVIVSNGYMSGRPGNVLAPADNITRAEAVTLIDKISGEYINNRGEYTRDISGNLVVSSSDVTLKNMTIAGDLILAQGIGDGRITLDGVHVKGRTVVLGGGEDRVIINDSVLAGTLTVKKKNGKVGIVARGTTSASDVKLKSGVTLAEAGNGTGFNTVEIVSEDKKNISLEGNFNQVSIKGSHVDLSILDGIINGMAVLQNVQDIHIRLEETAEITTLQTDAAAVFAGTGTIMIANITANKVAFESPPGAINLAEGVSATAAGQRISVSTDLPAGSGVSGSMDIASSTAAVEVGRTLQMKAEVSPSGAAPKTVVWSVAKGTGSATISSNGLLTATGTGTVTVIAVSEVSSAN